MSKYKQYVNDVTIAINEMSTTQALAYGLLLSLRYFDFYLNFHKVEKFGDPNILLQIQHSALKKLQNSDELFDFNLLKGQIESVIPDSEDFEDCSDAMDSGVIHSYLTEYLLTNEKECITNAAILIYDLFDRYAQAALYFDIYTPKIEEELEMHNVIVENISNEFFIIQELCSLKRDDALIEFIQKTKSKKFKLN